jgi:hypothetical protein
MDIAMDIRIFIGAHRTAGLHIENILAQNETLLASQGIIVASHAAQLSAFKDATLSLDAGDSEQDVRDAYINALTKGADFEKLVILDRRRCGSVTRPARKNLIFPQVRYSLARFTKFLPKDSYKFFMGLRAPSTFLPSCYSESLTHAKVETFDEFLSDTDLRNLRWSETLERIVRSFSENDDDEFSATKLVTWRFEDYPRMWRDVVGAICGINNPQDLVGDAFPVNQGLSLYGCQLMYKYLQEHEPKASGDFKKIRDAFLEKFAHQDDMDPDPIGPPEFIESLDYAYEDDWYYIQRMENVVALSAQPRI